MADDATYLREIAQLKQDVHKANEEAKRWRLKLRDARKDLEAITAERDALNQQVQEFESSTEDLDQILDQFEQLNEWRAENEPLLEELQTLRTAHEELTGELETTKAKLALPPDEANKKLREYQDRELRLAHEKAWQKAAAEVLGADGKKYRLHPEAKLETVWREAGYDPLTGDPDDAQISEAISKAREALPIAFQPVETTNDGGAAAAAAAARAATPAPVAQTKGPGPGASRGAPARESGGLTATKAQMRDPVFMAGLQRQLEASPEARASFRIVDE